MKHLLILFFLLTTNAFAQGPFGDYAVVKDKDGYVNMYMVSLIKNITLLTGLKLIKGMCIKVA